MNEHRPTHHQDKYLPKKQGKYLELDRFAADSPRQRSNMQSQTKGDARQQIYEDDEELLLPNGNVRNTSVNDEGALPTFLESPVQHKQRILSLKLVLLTNFLSAAGFSLLLSSMWQYVRSLGGQEIDYGATVAAFSIGQLIGAPFWGMFSTKYSYKLTFVLTILIRMLGNLFYCEMANIPVDWETKKYLMILSRAFVGFGAGSMAVANAYVAGATTLQERLKWMGLIAATGGAGFVVGPLIGSAFSSIPETSTEFIDINFMTAPAFMASALCVINIVLLLVLFKETRSVGAAGQMPKVTELAVNNAGSINGSDEPVVVVPKRDMVAVYSLIFIYFGIYVIMSLGETVGLPMTETEFKWDPKKASLWNGLIQGIFGLQSIVFFTLTGVIAKKIGPVQAFLFGMGVTVFSQFIMIPLFDPNDIARTNTTRETWPNGTTPDGFNNTTDVATECVFYWCGRQKQLPLAQYIVGMFFIYIGFPISIVMLFTLFSKVLGPSPQGGWMGLLNASGSLARSVGPPVISFIFRVGGPLVVYTASCGVMTIVFLYALIMKQRFVPFGTKRS
eukprot:m.30904 g.30904  ORF g.30904 m.30904 type:complete len:561 (-) comp16358_c1_seq1:100-1782(-)